MKTVENYLEFVKEQCDFHRRMAVKHAPDKRRSEQHSLTADRFEELYEFLDRTQNQKKDERKRITLGLDEISDLPPELIGELSISDADRTEFNVLSVVSDAGGVTSLDRILIGYYRLTGEVVKRTQMTNRIYRMIQKGMLYPVPGKKGVYSLEEMSEEEASTLV